jgi:hypothetical protein
LKIKSEKELNKKEIENAILWLKKEFRNETLRYFELARPEEDQ